MTVFSAMPPALQQRLAAADGASLGPPWPSPQPLPSGMPAVDPFSPDLLPEAFRPWIVDVSERMQCPPDYPAVAAMVAAAATVGRQVVIRPKRRDNWAITSNLWGVVVGRPGLLKTPSIEEALRPLKAFEADAAKKHEDDLKEYQAEQLFRQESAKILQAKVREALKKGDNHLAVSLAKEDIGPINVPKRRRYITNDSTVEALGVLLNANPRGLLVFRDELIGFLKTMDREGHEADRGFYLESWNGNGRYTYDRIGRGTIDIEACCVSILGGIQPGPLSDYLRAAVREGSGDDGLIQRFQLAVWPEPSADWRNVDRYPNRDAKNRFTEVFRRLDSLDLAAIGVLRDEFDPMPYLQFDRAAQEAFDQWRTELETRLRSGQLHPALEAHLAKYRSLIPSLALIGHLIDGGVGPVAEQQMIRAAAWGEYLESHAQRLYWTVTHGEVESTRQLARRIRKGDLADGFTLRDVYRHGWTSLATRTDAQAAVEVLVDLDWLKPEDRPTGGRLRTVHWVNPSIEGLACAG